MGRSIQIEVWNKSYVRRGYINSQAVTLPDSQVGFISLHATVRVGAASDCDFTIAADHPLVEDLMTAGARCVVTYRYEDGATPIRLISGRVQTPSGANPSKQSTRTFAIRDDWSILNSTTGWPSPDAAIGSQASVGYYTKSGPAETVALDLIKQNYVDSPRLNQPLVLPTSLGRGSNISVQFRMDYLADKLYPAVINAGVIVEIGQVGDHREVTIREPATYGPKLTEGSGVVVNGSFSMDAPTATRVIVGIAGTDTTPRIFRQFINTAAEAEIGEPLEVFVDASDIALTDDVTAEAQKRADEAFADNAAKVSLDITLIEQGAFMYGKAFREGDNVKIQLYGTPVFTDYVREVEVNADADGGIAVSPHVGDWQDDPDSKLFAQVDSMDMMIRSVALRTL